jgi:hypothetical protein
MLTGILAVCGVGTAVLAPLSLVQQQEPETFRLVPHGIATGLRGGYQVIAADLNRDGRPDLITVSSGMSQLLWFENPGWQRHVIASGLSAPINASAADLDGDGIPELALAHGFTTSAQTSVGNVSLFTHGTDVTQPWTMRELDRTPTAHRLRWLRAEGGSHWLINGPLIGESLRAPEYRGSTPIHFYRPPDWKRETVTTAEEGVVHAIEIMNVPGNGAMLGTGFVSAGFLGVSAYRYDSRTASWNRSSVVPGDPAPWPRSGASEIASVRVGGTVQAATIEPWHGTKVVVYRNPGTASERMAIDTTLTDAHVLIAADFDGDGTDELVAGERGGARTLRVYRLSGNTWARYLVDPGGMAGAGCTAVDLNTDGRVDLACIGTATANLKWYENIRP